MSNIKLRSFLSSGATNKQIKQGMRQLQMPFFCSLLPSKPRVQTELWEMKSQNSVKTSSFPSGTFTFLMTCHCTFTLENPTIKSTSTLLNVPTHWTHAFTFHNHNKEFKKRFILMSVVPRRGRWWLQFLRLAIFGFCVR